jgi:hypothetical protein
MRKKDIVISTIDLLVLFLTITIIALFAVKYESDKGSGSHDFISVVPLNASFDISGNLKSFDFYPVVLGIQGITVFHYFQGKSNEIGVFNTTDALEASGVLNNKNVYVIYEKEITPFFPETIRLFSRKSIPVGIARVAK